MAAHEQHEQRVVLVRDFRRRRGLLQRDALTTSPGSVGAQLVDQPALGGLKQPAARLLGNVLS
jgi:hypothetical protein